MKKKALKFLNIMCGSCLGMLGFLELNKISYFFFGEPKRPKKTEE